MKIMVFASPNWIIPFLKRICFLSFYWHTEVAVVSGKGDARKRNYLVVLPSPSPLALFRFTHWCSWNKRKKRHKKKELLRSSSFTRYFTVSFSVIWFTRVRKSLPSPSPFPFPLTSLVWSGLKNSLTVQPSNSFPKKIFIRHNSAKIPCGDQEIN